MEQALKVYERFRDDQGIETLTASLGHVYEDLGQHDKALEYFEACVKVSRKRGHAGMEGECLFNLATVYADRYQSKKDLEQAIERFEQALKIYERLRDENGIGGTYQSLGSSYARLGQNEKAAAYFEQCLKISTKIGNEEMEELALSNLGAVHDRRGQYRKAVEYHEKALAIGRKRGDKKREATCLLNIGLTYGLMIQSRKAVEYLNQALDTALRLKDAKLEAEALYNLAEVYSRTGNSDKAAQFCQKALATFKANGHVESEGHTLSLLGVICFDRGQYSQAIEYYLRSLEIARKLGDPAGEGRELTKLGKVYRDIGQYDKALECLQRSIEVSGEVGGRDKAIGIIDLGTIHAQRGDYKAALEMLKRGLSILEGSGVDAYWPNYLIANIYLDLGDADKAEPHALSLKNGPLYLPLRGRYCLLKGDYEDAKTEFQKYLKLYKDAKDLIISCTGLGLTYEAMQDYPKAAEYFTKAVDQTEELRSGLNAAERANFFNVKVWGFARTESYEGLTRVLMKLNKPVDALKQSEYTKARIFAESMSRRSSQASVKVPEDVLKKDSRLNDHLASLLKKRQEAYEKGYREVIDSVEPQIKEIKGQLQTHIDMLRKDYPLFAATKYPQPMDVEQTAVKLEEWTLAYQVTDTGICTWLLKGKTLVKSLFKPIPRKELNELVRSFRKPLDMQEITSKNLLAFKGALGTGKTLFTLLAGDFLESIPEGQPLIILPDGMLGVLPFEMLVIKEGTGWNESSKRPYPEGWSILVIGTPYRITNH